MTPKKVKYILPDVALENQEDLALLQKLNSFYWDKIRETLSNTYHNRVNIINLGVFRRKHKNVDKKIKKVTSLIKAFKNKNRQVIVDSLEKDLELLNNVKDFDAQEKLRKNEIKTIKHEYYKNLEK